MSIQDLESGDTLTAKTNNLNDDVMVTDIINHKVEVQLITGETILLSEEELNEDYKQVLKF
jgi:hypothetical protein